MNCKNWLQRKHSPVNNNVGHIVSERHDTWHLCPTSAYTFVLLGLLSLHCGNYWHIYMEQSPCSIGGASKPLTWASSTLELHSVVTIIIRLGVPDKSTHTKAGGAPQRAVGDAYGHDRSLRQNVNKECTHWPTVWLMATLTSRRHEVSVNGRLSDYMAYDMAP